MKRLTVSLPDVLAAALDDERQRRDVPASTIIREAVEQYLRAPAAPGRLRIAALGASGQTNISEMVEEILEREWGGLGELEKSTSASKTLESDASSSDVRRSA